MSAAGSLTDRGRPFFEAWEFVLADALRRPRAPPFGEGLRRRGDLERSRPEYAAGWRVKFDPGSL